MVTTGPIKSTETVSCWLRSLRYDQPICLRNVTPAALQLYTYVIHYTDILSLNVFGRGGFSLKLAKLCHFTARAVLECLRAGAHCVSQRDILRSDFWKLLTSGISETYNWLNKLFYSD
jgi:hypothetical protein